MKKRLGADKEQVSVQSRVMDCEITRFFTN